MGCEHKTSYRFSSLRNCSLIRQLKSLLAELNISTVHYKTINAKLKETGKMVEKTAMDSTDEALHNEIKAVEQLAEKRE